MSSPFHRLIPVILVILVVLVPHWKLATMQGVVITDDIFTSDLMNDGFPYRFYLGTALRNGDLPLWYPPVYGGFPLLARAESGVAFPPNIILFGLLPPYIALNVTILLTLVVAGAGTTLFARTLGAGLPGSVIAGVSFAYSGFMVSHLKHLSMVGTVSLFPVALLLLERGLAASARDDRRRFHSSLIGFAFVFGMQILAGHLQTAYYAALVYCAYGLLRIANLHAGGRKGGRREKRDRLRTLVARLNRPATYWLAGALLLGGAGVGAVQVLPTYELVGLSQRSGGVDFAYASDYGYDPANAATFFVPGANGQISEGSYRGRGIFWEDYGYVGLFTILLAFAGVVLGRREWHVRFFAAGTLIAYLLVLGPNTPVYAMVFHLVPGMEYFRFPTRFLFIVDAFLVLLASFGATYLLGRIGKRRVPRNGIELTRPPALILIALVTADLVIAQMPQNAVADLDTWSTSPRTAQILARDSSLFRIYTPGASDAHKIAFARARGWSGDLAPYLAQREFLQPSSNVLYGIASGDGYAQLTPTYVVDVWGDQNRSGLIYRTAGVDRGMFRPTPAFMKILSMFNVKYTLCPWPFAPGFTKPVATIDGVFVSENPGVLGRARLVSSYRIAAGESEVLALIGSTDFDPAQEVILAAPPDFHGTDGPAGTAVIERYGPTEVQVQVSAPGERLLVLADTWYPGWKAEVDGVERPILRGNVSQRVVVVPAGTHTVRFTFDSSTVWAGGAITLVSILGLAGLSIVVLRNSHA